MQKERKALWNGGGRTRARTWDPLIKSQLLYQLSYAPDRLRGFPLVHGSSTKAILRCPGRRARLVYGPKKMENRRGLTRRLPCVGSRVGGLGYDRRAS